MNSNNMKKMMFESVTISGKEIKCDKHGNQFRTLKGVQLKAGDVVAYKGNSLLVTDVEEDSTSNLLTFLTRNK